MAQLIKIKRLLIDMTRKDIWDKIESGELVSSVSNDELNKETLAELKEIEKLVQPDNIETFFTEDKDKQVESLVKEFYKKLSELNAGFHISVVAPISKQPYSVYRFGEVDLNNKGKDDYTKHASVLLWDMYQFLDWAEYLKNLENHKIITVHKPVYRREEKSFSA